MAVGTAAAKGAEEILKKLQQMLIKAKNSGNKARAAEIEKKIAQTRITISKANEAKKVKEGKAVPKMSRKEQETVKKNIKKDLGGKTEAVKRKEAAAYAKAATSPEAKKTSGSVATKRGRRNKTNQYEAGRYKGRTSKKPGEMYKASPNTPETVAGKKVTKSTTEKKPSSAKGRNKTTPTKKPRITGPKANTSPQKMQKAEKPRLTGPKANVKVAEKPRLRKKAKASPSAPVMPKTTKPKVKVQDKTAPKKTPANKQVPAGKPRIRGPKAGVTQNKTVPAGKPRIRGPKAGMRQSAPSSQVKTDKTRNAPARAVAAKKRAGMSRGRKTELGLAATGALALGAMMGRDDGKKKSDASPTKPASKPKPKRVTTGTGGNANRTNRTSVTSGATKPRKETEKKKKESRYEKKWGTLRWGDEGELPQVQYRKRKRK